MRAIRTVALRCWRAWKSTPSQVGSSKGEVRVLSGALRESPGAAGEDSHRCRKACGGRRSMERWLGPREPAGDIRRTPIPTTERELELRKKLSYTGPGSSNG